MHYIFITRTFRGQIKGFRKVFQEKDLLEDIKDFVQNGLRKGETTLKAQQYYEITLETVKLRFYFRKAAFRYLVGVISDSDSQRYIPIIIDRKAGPYGQNLTLKTDKKTRQAIQKAIVAVMSDYLAYTEDQEKNKESATVYKVV
ncbi:MAG: hypothetical protein HQL69_01640 [Magnetococcales bacterium]|nr:hypothetical protein [Magnetococcales bacterium]